MSIRFCYALAAVIAIAGIARADCASGSCSLASRSRATSSACATSSVATVAVAAPVRVSERSVLRVRQTAGAARGRLFHRSR